MPVQECTLPYLSACTGVQFTLTQCLYKGALYLTLYHDADLHHKNVRGVASSALPRDMATIAAPWSSTCCSITHKTFRGKTRLEAGLCQLHNFLPLLTVCLNPRAAAVSCTDRPVIRPDTTLISLMQSLIISRQQKLGGFRYVCANDVDVFSDCEDTM